MRKRRIVALLSGGIDSSTVCVWLLRRSYQVLPLFIDYGQNASRSEWSSANEVARYLDILPVQKLSISSLGKGLDFRLVEPNIAVNTHESYLCKSRLEFFPHRNLLLATLAGVWAENVKASGIALGIVGGGSHSYPDTTRNFVQQLNRVLRLSSEVAVVTPFVQKTKSDVVVYGLRASFDYRLTYSCNLRSAPHCGRCASCIERSITLGDLLPRDPTKYRRVRLTS